MRQSRRLPVVLLTLMLVVVAVGCNVRVPGFPQLSSQQMSDIAKSVNIDLPAPKIEQDKAQITLQTGSADAYDQLFWAEFFKKKAAEQEYQAKVAMLIKAQGPSTPTDAQLAKLRNKENGGKYYGTNPSGKYMGAYQFDQRTWNSVAATFRPWLVGVAPNVASPADQDAMARQLFAQRGTKPWPEWGHLLLT